ncbi:diguanylate cyclase (GGDEF) domain-containing protein [Geodermatophilus telluris]|uniref:Diguanylate cyclase (GGDEF) domain-containing protein n=1 Tax=Geodermatophilus telluris TaxID=1190417 RepID=A0A1G6S2Y9_9ACTN|nr:GGDEF domain-containing protein [Geodermatophilus telluris]SDD11034.1 diguanylate cyclase (GGDEF) domain-containing protein [Geodermatophilus telluris]
MRPLAQDEERVDFWRRHTIGGVVLCVVLPVIVLVRTWITAGVPNAAVIVPIALAVAVPAPLLLLVPVERLVRHPRGRLFYDAWEAAGIALVIVLCLLDGGTTSPYVLFLFVLLAHAALAYPPIGVALAGTTIVAGYLTMGLVDGSLRPSDLLVGVLALAVATGTCAFASANHVRAYERTAAYAQEIAALARRDGLTGTLNHRAFHERLDAHVRRSAADHPVSLLIVDVDSFKTVNDTFGHPAGDGVLQLVGATLTELTRPGDVAGRLGGDEFALLLPGTATPEAAAIAERLRARVGSADAALGATLSVGVATATAPDATALHAAADAAAYRAKRGGRDRVVTAADGTEGTAHSTEDTAVPVP